MASFCRQCTAELFGYEFVDKNDMMRPTMASDEMVADLCEHCGPGWFDKNGVRVPQWSDLCSKCGETVKSHYQPTMLKWKLGPSGTFGLKPGAHTPHIAGYHAPRHDG